jgi:hypothetical protein
MFANPVSALLKAHNLYYRGRLFKERIALCNTNLMEPISIGLPCLQGAECFKNFLVIIQIFFPGFGEDW